MIGFTGKWDSPNSAPIYQIGLLDTGLTGLSGIMILCTSIPSESVDKGWAWVVCGIAFTVNFCVGGLLNSFGVLYAGLVDYYSTSTSPAATNVSNSSSVPSDTEGINGLIGTNTNCQTRKHN